MEDISRKIVDEIEAGKLEQAKNSIFDGIKGKAAETVDMKRVEKSVNWMTDNTSEGEVEK
jgi:hypothetical protein|tara:strand:+ start:559 stop:738 length:180 start_codon:yes stop_codon:yes gene_type:complete